MATIKELLKSGNRFTFRGKTYKFLSYIPSPAIEMIDEDGDIFSFGVDGRIKDDFILLPNAEVSGGPYRPLD